jgi:hypothetical protein
MTNSLDPTHGDLLLADAAPSLFWRLPVLRVA